MGILRKFLVGEVNDRQKESKKGLTFNSNTNL
jgi:hypothetical protein